MTLLLTEFTFENTISPMGISGVVTHPEVADHIQDCIANLDINEDFDAQDVLAYLYEMYGGPESGPMQWINAGNLENALETYLCPSYDGRHKYERPVGVEFCYDWQNYETYYWRIF